jgi:hypothetical protein
LLINPRAAGLQPEWVLHHRLPRVLVDLIGDVVRH